MSAVCLGLVVKAALMPYKVSHSSTIGFEELFLSRSEAMVSAAPERGKLLDHDTEFHRSGRIDAPMSKQRVLASANVAQTRRVPVVLSRSRY